MSEPGCCCKRRNAYDCMAYRYPGEADRPWEEREPCECACHDEEPDAYDDALADVDRGEIPLKGEGE